MSVMIETPRLLMGPPEMADWEAFAAFLGSDRTQFIGGPYSRPKAWRHPAPDTCATAEVCS